MHSCAATREGRDGDVRQKLAAGLPGGIIGDV